MRKTEIEMHRDGWYGDPLPSVNVKVRAYGEDFLKAFDEAWPDYSVGDAADPRARAMYEDALERYDEGWLFQAACEIGWERAQEDAEQIFTDYAVKIESQGRSGGHLVVRGLPDVEEWDAVLVQKWARFARYVRSEVNEIPYVMADLWLANTWEGYRTRIGSALAPTLEAEGAGL